ncbi:MAG: dephospho-CoA kinase [Polaribacter sp.]|jgi:dephospho-CoA kinase
MVVGLTGGIGSGKSTVLERFNALGDIAVYNADVEAKKLMNTSPVIKSKLIHLFGEEAYKNQQLNRAFISGIVFSDTEKLKELNTIVHPEVYSHLISFIEKNQSKEYVLYENAILFENNSDVFCDYIITVIAAETTRIERVISRDNVSEKEVKDRINNQWIDSKKALLSNYVVINEDLKTLDCQIVKIHNNLTKKKASI